MIFIQCWQTQILSITSQQCYTSCQVTKLTLCPSNLPTWWRILHFGNRHESRWCKGRVHMCTHIHTHRLATDPNKTHTHTHTHTHTPLVCPKRGKAGVIFWYYHTFSLSDKAMILSSSGRNKFLSNNPPPWDHPHLALLASMMGYHPLILIVIPWSTPEQLPYSGNQYGDN